MLVLVDQLFDVRPGVFGLTLQHDEDGGMLAQLQQVQEALPEKTPEQPYSRAGVAGRRSQPDLKLLAHQSCSR